MRDPYEVLGLAPDATLDDAEHAYHHRLLRCHPDLHTAEGPDAVRRAENETRDLNEAITRLRRGYRPYRPGGGFGGAGSRPGSGSSRGAGARSYATGTSTDPSGGFGTGAHGAGGFGTGGQGGSGWGQAGGGASPFGRPWWSSYGPPGEEDPWPGSARSESARVHRPVPCPFCEAPVTSLDAFYAHLYVAHPRIAGPRGRSIRRHRHPRRTRHWWPLPLWQVAIVNLVLGLVAISVVSALGGPTAVLTMLPGHYTPATMCQVGPLLTNQVTGAPRCDPANTNWPWILLLFGMGFTVFVWAWRETTRKR